VRLTELDPEFLVVEGPDRWRRTDDIRGADGVIFLCPKCFAANGGPIGTHRVICWSPKVPPDMDPKPDRWNLVGTGYEDLSLVAGSSSILLTSGCRWHGFVKGGEVTGA